MKPSLGDRDRLIAALQSVRNAMIAARADAPTLPPLLSAEENLLHALFDEREVEEYLTSPGAEVYGRRVSADLATSWWRVGRRNKRVVYALYGDVATDDDPMIGSFDTPALAFEAVRAHNELLGKSTRP